MTNATSLADRPPPRPNQDILAADVRRIVDTAGRLKAAARAGRPARALAGKNLALVYSVHPVAEGSPLQRAGLALGARISNVQFGDAWMVDSRVLKESAQMLGRLYDLVDCGSLAAPVVAQIERHAGIPVFRGLDRHEHAASVLADLLSISEQCIGSAKSNPIDFECRTRTQRCDAFEAFGKQLGFEIRMPGSVHRAANETVFRVDATDVGNWLLLGPVGLIDDADREENHRFVLQAVLLGAVFNAT